MDPVTEVPDTLWAHSVELDKRLLTNLLAMSATFTLVEDAAQSLDEVGFDDDEVAVLIGLPEELRLHLTARLAHMTESVRESLRDLDAVVLRLRELIG